MLHKVVETGIYKCHIIYRKMYKIANIKTIIEFIIKYLTIIKLDDIINLTKRKKTKLTKGGTVQWDR